MSVGTPKSEPPNLLTAETLSTHQVADLLGMAVRSVQLMVDRGDLHAWKTPGGHRRIAGDSVRAWLEAQAVRGALSVRGEAARLPSGMGVSRRRRALAASHRHAVLLIEDSVHSVNMVRLLMQHHFPHVDLHVEHDGIAGLITAGRLQPCALLVDILLPGIDGATLVNGLRAHPDFAQRGVVILTGLSEAERQPYAFALQGVPIIAKTDVVTALPAHLHELLRQCPFCVADQASLAGLERRS